MLTLDGMVTMTIPPGSQPDSQLLLKGRGIRDVQDRTWRGHQYVRLRVLIPATVTPRQKELLEEFEIEEEKRKGQVGAKKVPFSLDQAFKRLKEFMGDKGDKEKESKEGNKEEKEKNHAN